VETVSGFEFTMMVSNSVFFMECRVDAAVIKFNPLADAVRAAAENHNFFAVLPFTSSSPRS